MTRIVLSKTGDSGGTDLETPGRTRLTYDLDVDVCVVGGGLAGLTTALECVKKGASVAVLEGRRVGWNASGTNIGAVLPGYGVPVSELIERVGFDSAKELWTLAQEGADYVRRIVTENELPGMSLADGALEVSNVDSGDELVRRLQVLGAEFGTDAEGWQIDHVRAALDTKRYFHAIHYPKAFAIDGRRYVHELAMLAEKAGVRIFEDTPVVAIDPAGIRKRVSTPSGRVRCSDVVLAGNMHLGAAATRLAATVIPVWRYAAMTAPLGEKLAEAIKFTGSIADTDTADQFRIVDGDRLLWSSFERSWQARPTRFARAIARRIAKVFPTLGKIQIDEVWSGSYGQTVHGMPQIGMLRPGLWVASGFGRQGLNTSAMGGLLVSRGMLWGEERWKLFSPFELVWAGGTPGRMAYQAVYSWSKGASAAAGTLARFRERARLREDARERAYEVRIAAAKKRAASAHGRAASAHGIAPSRSNVAHQDTDSAGTN